MVRSGEEEQFVWEHKTDTKLKLGSVSHKFTRLHIQKVTPGRENGVSEPEGMKYYPLINCTVAEQCGKWWGWRELSKGGFPLKIIILGPVYIWWGCKQNLMIRFLFWKDHYVSNLREKLKEKWETSSVYGSHISLCIICILGVFKNPDFWAMFQICWIRIYKGGAQKFEMLNVHR